MTRSAGNCPRHLLTLALGSALDAAINAMWVLFVELLYDDVFSVWETIWAARHVSSPHFVLFLALALVECYRDIIIDNCMDFTDIIKLFNGTYSNHDQIKSNFNSG